MDSAAVRRSARRIAETAKMVRVCDATAAADAVLAGMEAQRYSLAAWSQHALHPTGTSDSHADWVFVMDTLNFCFWTPDGQPPFTVKYRDQCYTGYWSLCAALRRASEEGIDMFDPKVYGSLSLEQLQHVFRSETSTTIPLLERRQKNLQEVAGVLIQEFGGTFANCVRQCRGDTQALVRLVTDKFPCFRDGGLYNGEQVWLLKRAQILVADIWGCFQGTGLGAFHNISELTMFADYRVPQILVHLGLLHYSEEALARLRSGALLPHGDELEMEIRGCSVQAVEELTRCLRARGAAAVDVHAVMLDFYLWDLAKASQAALSAIPIHHTLDIFY